MREVAGVPARFLGLRLAMRKKLVDLFGQRPDFGGKIVADPGLFARPDRGHLIADTPQWPQTVEGLKRCQRQKTDPKRTKAPDQGLAQVSDLLVNRLPRLGDLEPPAHR